MIGALSDRLHTRWGRRRPFLLWFSIPFGLSFIFLWSAPAMESQAALLIYVTLAFMLADTLQTLVGVPFLSLTPELTADYDERTTLTSYRSFFQLFGALTVVIAAPMIVDGVVAAGGTQQQGFMLVGALFGGIGAIPLLLLGIFVREHTTAEQTEAMPFRETLQAAWQNIPFRYAAGMHMLNWSAVDMLWVAFPFFLVYWVAQGDMLASINFLGVNLAYESAFFGILAGTENPKLLQAFGINVPLMITLTYGFGVGLAAFAGVLAGPIFQVNPLMGSNPIIGVLAVVVIGGVGSIMGSIVTGLGLGLVEGLTRVFYPEASAVVIFVIMAIVLLARPAGLFGREK